MLKLVCSERSSSTPKDCDMMGLLSESFGLAVSAYFNTDLVLIVGFAS